MTGEPDKSRPVAEFLTSVKATLKDSRLWLIVLPSLALCGLSLVLLKTTLATLMSLAVALVASRLINQIETLPKADGGAFARNFYRNVLFPASVGVMVISNSDLLARVWFMLWHWFHTMDAIPSCPYILAGGMFSWLGVPVTAAITALIAKRHAVFATIAGLMIYIPLSLTISLNGGVSKMASIVAKSCQLDVGSFDISFAEGFGAGMISAILIGALVSIFVARVVSNWLSRENPSAFETRRVDSGQP
jgi:hypothetical protein